MYNRFAKTERVILTAYGLILLLLFAGAIVAGTVFRFIVGPNAAFLYAIILAQWFLIIAVCALMFCAALLLLLGILRSDSRIRVRMIALLVSLTPILFLASVDFRLPYSGEYEGETRVEYLLWRMEKTDNPTRTVEYRELESMLTTVRDEEARTAIERALAGMRNRK